MLVHKMGTVFAEPEASIVDLNEDSADMYFVQSGDCIVNFTDYFGKTIVAHRLLVESDYFGEIGLIYRSKRTC